MVVSREGGYTFSVVSNFRGVVRGCCQRDADRGGDKMWEFDNILSYRGHGGLNGNIYKKTLVEAEGSAHFSKPIFYLYCFSCEGMLLCCNMHCPVGSWMGGYGRCEQ